jgi:hypothetical protein
MDSQALLESLNATDLTVEATALIAWDIGVVSTEDEVANFMYRGGGFPPQASTKPPPSEDRRPDRKYWEFVKAEMHVFLCTDDKKYRALWKQIGDLQKKSTTAIVGVVATFLGASVGAPATLLVGFVSVCFYAALKVGKEAYCGYSLNSGA